MEDRDQLIIDIQVEIIIFTSIYFYPHTGTGKMSPDGYTRPVKAYRLFVTLVHTTRIADIGMVRRNMVIGLCFGKGKQAAYHRPYKQGLNSFHTGFFEFFNQNRSISSSDLPAVSGINFQTISI